MKSMRSQMLSRYIYGRSAAVIVAVCVLILIFALCCFPQLPFISEERTKQIRVGLSWSHEAQFAGLYWADKHGYYREEGLDVEFVPYTGEDLARALADQKYDFALLQTDTLILARARGLRVKAVFADYQLLPTCFFSKKHANITKPEHLIGKTVGVTYSERYPLLAMLMKKGINPSYVKIVERDPSLGYSALADGSLDVEAGWITDDETVRAAVGEYNVIYCYDYGVNWYADIIATTDDMITHDRETVEKFVSATARGWRDAIANADEAALLAEEYESSLNESHLKHVLECSIPLIFIGDRPLGWMDESAFRNAQEILVKLGTLQKQIDVNTLFTTEFIKI